jgi:hypothetical protein
VAASLFVLFPVLQALRHSLARSLQEGGPQRGTTLRGRKFRAELVMAEVALRSSARGSGTHAPERVGAQ